MMLTGGGVRHDGYRRRGSDMMLTGGGGWK